jgi:hypothetical protein
MWQAKQHNTSQRKPRKTFLKSFYQHPHPMSPPPYSTHRGQKTAKTVQFPQKTVQLAAQRAHNAHKPQQKPQQKNTTQTATKKHTQKQPDKKPQNQNHPNFPHPTSLQGGWPVGGTVGPSGVCVARQPPTLRARHATVRPPPPARSGGGWGVVVPRWGCVAFRRLRFVCPWPAR